MRKISYVVALFVVLMLNLCAMEYGLSKTDESLFKCKADTMEVFND